MSWIIYYQYNVDFVQQILRKHDRKGLSPLGITEWYQNQYYRNNLVIMLSNE